MARVVNVEKLVLIGTPGSIPERIREFLGEGSAIVTIEELTIITADHARLVEALTQALNRSGGMTV